MNVFVLNTGRCGSTAFIRACEHVSNFTSAHESRAGLLGQAHFTYPENHIEADNRLSWFLGRLDRDYGNNAFYVHLKRNDNDTAESYARRLFNTGIIPAYRNGILIDVPDDASNVSVSLDYCDTVNSNIELFLKDKTDKMEFNLESAKEDFHRFWGIIGAEGDLDTALAEFDTLHNASVIYDSEKQKQNLPTRVFRKLHRVAVKLPDYVKNA